MQEGLEQREAKRISTLDDADYIVNGLWDKGNDLSELPEDQDMTALAWREDVFNRAEEFGRVLFDEARSSALSPLEAAITLERMLELLPVERANEVLATLMTTREAVAELIRKLVEAKNKKDAEGGLMAKLKKLATLFRNPR